MLDTKMREDILESLNQLLNEKPLSKITIMDVAERCGVSRQTIYYHFNNLEEMSKALYDLQLELFFDRIKEYTEVKEIIVEMIKLAQYSAKLVSNYNHDKYKSSFDNRSQELLKQILVRIIDDELEAKISKSEYDRVINFYSYAFIGTLRDLGRDDIDIEQEATYLIEMMQNGIRLKI